MPAAAIALAPDLGEIWHARADVEYSLGLIEQSLSSYRRVLDLEPENSEAWLDYGETLYEYGMLHEALSAAGRARELEPDWADAHILYARLAFLLRSRRKGIEALQFALEHFPDLRQHIAKEFPIVRTHEAFADYPDLRQ